MSAVEQFMVTENDPGPVPLLIGLMGAPGSGKTFSALTLADGMRVAGLGKPVLIDTERGRSRKYRDAFDFRRIDLAPPFKPGRFLGAVQAALAEKPCAVIVDSLSDEHEGEGGVIDWHDAEVPSSRGNEWAAWKVPKDDRRRMIAGFLQVMTPLILCFRAREKTKQIANERGKVVPTNIGFQPIAPLEIVHALDLNIMLPPKSDGRPKWRTDKAHEDFVIKQPEQFKALFGTGQPLTKRIGAELAAWARGDHVTVAPENEAAFRAAMAEAQLGRVAFHLHWKALGADERDLIRPRLTEIEAEIVKGEQDSEPFEIGAAESRS